jgi:photosystem II protein
LFLITGVCIIKIKTIIINYFSKNKDNTMEAKIQFIKGFDERVLPDVRLTRSRDGSTGTATFRFKNPNILDKNTTKEGEITGMYLVDEEGVLETRDVNARFINGKPEAIESIYIMKSSEAWDRFMRFMERYGKTNGLVFTKAS